MFRYSVGPQSVLRSFIAQIEYTIHIFDPKSAVIGQILWADDQDYLLAYLWGLLLVKKGMDDILAHLFAKESWLAYLIIPAVAVFTGTEKNVRNQSVFVMKI